MNGLRLAGLGVIIGVSSVVLLPTAVHADPPGPTDYRTVITWIEPSTTALDISIVGGDSFVDLAVQPGVTAEVPGYFGEPYLRFAADGRVEENRASRTYYANASRYGGGIPEAAETAAPRWVTVSTDGSYAWHDHRTHWMSPARPPGKEPGDVILGAELRLLVDESPVVVHIQSTWLPSPSRGPALAGVIVGLAAVAAILWWRRRPIVALSGVGAVAGTALVFGLAACRSVPPETGPPSTLWTLPSASLLVVTVTAVARSRWSRWTRTAGAIVAAMPLAVWGWLRREATWRAFIPTDAPMWADRAVIAVVFVVGTGLVVGLFALLFMQPTRRGNLETDASVLTPGTFHAADSTDEGRAEG